MLTSGKLSLIGVTASIPLLYLYSLRSKEAPIDSNEPQTPYKTNKNIIKVAVDSRFYNQLIYILKICVPSYNSNIVALLALHTLFLVLRTYLTVVVARIDGMLVRELVRGNGERFMKGIALFMTCALPATFTNSMVSFVMYFA